METRVRPATDVLFCKKGGDLKCCFSNVKCVENYEFINDEVRKGKETSSKIIVLDLLVLVFVNITDA